ncbi:MAG: Outer membrane protein assembly factor BamA [Paracidovorax wautersii]|uniref:Outer membrane protein assembly factor BamA n=1 Tax=Paracidovorax wautersii TaxID=1177982 RepID=A0A7V8FQ93_9BURK|nr:MAG: Outer membrane protein assembly factor BamA [Paracidovorax wautersii]
MKTCQRRLPGLFAAAALSLAAASACAAEDFTIRDIRVEGLSRIEPGTVFASLPVRVGDRYNDDRATQSIQALYALGLFSDVRVQTQGDVLVVQVQERPSIANVVIAGTKEFDQDTLKKALKDAGVAEDRPYDKATVDLAEQELKRQYISKSLYGAQVVSTVTPVDRNRVNLTFTVTEGTRAKIDHIEVVGNHAFGTSTLTDLFTLDTGNWMSWFSKSNEYTGAKLNADLEKLRDYYMTRGYLEFRIDSTQVAVSPDKQHIGIVINLTEGARFAVSDVRLEGSYLARDNEFKSRVTIRPGQPYDSATVAETVKAFKDHFGDFGYAFAQVETEPRIDHTTNQVALTLRADPGQRAYVRRIEVEGNDRTRDEVIRREFRQYEASWYDGAKIKLSRDRVDRLGYFTDVSVDTREVPGARDEVDLVVKVKEKPTGSLSVGAGYSSSDKLSLSFGVSQENVFGSGNYLGLTVYTGSTYREYSVTATNPYFTPEGISRTYDVYYRTQHPYDYQSDDDYYRYITQGVGVKFGVPVNEDNTIFFGAGFERVNVKDYSAAGDYIQKQVATFGSSIDTVPLTVGWSRDRRDSALVPTTGSMHSINTKINLVGDARYVRSNYQYQHYEPLSARYTLAFNGQLGWAKGLGNTLPFFSNFYAGGLGTVRGFEQGTLGPRDSHGNAIGGNKMAVANLELQTPFPGAGNDRTLRLYGFVDVGSAYGEDQSMTLGGLRASSGIGVSWISPIGPLRIAYAQPLRKKSTDKTERIQFQIGTSF